MGQPVNNKNIDLANIGDEVTYHAGGGTSTEKDIYLDIDHAVGKVHIANDKDFIIVSINGISFTDPKNVTAGKGFGFTASNNSGSHFSIDTIKIRAGDTSSHFEVMMW